MVNKINWSEAIFFFDIDDTLIETGKNSLLAAEGIFNVINSEIGENKARLIANRFKDIFNILANQHWAKVNSNSEYQNILKKINLLQKPVIDKFGSIRKWSREVFLKIASDDLEVELSANLINQAISSYWNIISQKSAPIEGVLSLFNQIKIHHRPIFLVTGSDARLILNKQGLFEYDPKHSEEFKEQRINNLKDKGILYDGLSIGDPEDKPHVDFFEKAINKAADKLKIKINNKNLIMFGDSYSADLQTPKEVLGFGLVVLFKKGQNELIEEGNQYISTGDILKVKQYLQ